MSLTRCVSYRPNVSGTDSPFKKDCQKRQSYLYIFDPVPEDTERAEHQVQYSVIKDQLITPI
jgi:hypothetical protein